MNEGRGREEHEILCFKRTLKSEVAETEIKSVELRAVWGYSAEVKEGRAKTQLAGKERGG